MNERAVLTGTSVLANALFVAGTRGDAQVGEGIIRDLAEDHRVTLQASLPDAQEAT